MARYIAKRLAYILLVFIVISFLMYLIYNAIPFDRARWLADEQKAAYKYNPEGLEQLYQEKRTELGLDKNIVERYLMWLGVMPLNGKYNGMLQGNFGVSYTNIQQPVVEVLKEPMKNTIFINILPRFWHWESPYRLVFCVRSKKAQSWIPACRWAV